MRLFDVYRISLFGHRSFDAHREVENKIFAELRKILQNTEQVEVYIGRNGEFDVFAASVIKRFQKSVGSEICTMTLVLPYTVRDICHYEKYYDSILIPIKEHPKAAIDARNKWMVENTDGVLVYVENTYGGAFRAMNYAKRLNKDIINMATPTDNEIIISR